MPYVWLSLIAGCIFIFIRLVLYVYSWENKNKYEKTALEVDEIKAVMDSTPLEKKGWIVRKPSSKPEDTVNVSDFSCASALRFSECCQACGRRGECEDRITLKAMINDGEEPSYAQPVIVKK